MHESETSEKRPEPVDNRSLFEKLQHQKLAKEEAFNEAAKFSNLIRRLDDDEIDFLASVNERKEREELRKRAQQDRAISKFREEQRIVDEASHRAEQERLRESSRQSGSQAVATAVPSTKQKRLGVSGVVKKDRKKQRVMETKFIEAESIDTSTATHEQPAVDEQPKIQAAKLIDYDSD